MKIFRIQFFLLFIFLFFIFLPAYSNQHPQTGKTQEEKKLMRKEARIQKIINSPIFQKLLAKAAKKSASNPDNHKVRNPNLLMGIIFILAGLALIFIPIALFQILGAIAIVLGLAFVIVSFIP